MAEFSYTAIGPTGLLLNGTMQARDAASVIERLQSEGSTPVRAVEIGARRAGWRRLLSPKPRLSTAQLTEFTRELAVLLPAGQSLDRALQFMLDTAVSARLRASIAALRGQLVEGIALSAALATQPENFPPLYIGLVRAGEAGGSLAATMALLADMLEEQRRLSATLQSAMVYPLCVLVAAIGSIELLLTQVLPQFEPLFAQSGASLPGPTRALIAAGDFASEQGPTLALLTLCLGVAGTAALRWPPLRLLADRVLLRLPLIGGFVREREAARLCRTLGSLLASGVALIPALGIARDVLGNRAARLAVEQASENARDGGGLARALARGGVFPQRSTHLLQLGEETARLGPMALKAAEIHEQSLRHRVQRMVALLGPAITILLGAAVAAIFAALVLAMLSLNDLAV